MPGAAVAGVDFVDLICADDDLVRAEFAAIVDAEWHDTPPTEDGEVGPAREPASDLPRPGPFAPVVGRPGGPHPNGVGPGARQRSPPRAG